MLGATQFYSARRPWHSSPLDWTEESQFHSRQGQETFRSSSLPGLARVVKVMEARCVFGTARTCNPSRVISRYAYPNVRESKCSKQLNKHITTKRKQLDLKLGKLYWFIGRKSQLSLENKLLVYKAILKYIDKWICTSNTTIFIGVCRLSTKP